jgi:N-acetylglutamate synthase-like GNAT family acetyltransferase
MFIRLATTADISYITHALAPKQIDYIKPNQARADVESGRLYVLEHEGQLIAQCALVREERYNYIAIKRMVAYKRSCKVRGVADKFITHFINMGHTLGATPWTENERMKHILTKNGFVYQYTFMDKYEFFLRK